MSLELLHQEPHLPSKRRHKQELLLRFFCSGRKKEKPWGAGDTSTFPNMFGLPRGAGTPIRPTGSGTPLLLWLASAWLLQRLAGSPRSGSVGQFLRRSTSRHRCGASTLRRTIRHSPRPHVEDVHIRGGLDAIAREIYFGL